MREVLLCLLSLYSLSLKTNHMLVISQNCKHCVIFSLLVTLFLLILHIMLQLLALLPRFMYVHFYSFVLLISLVLFSGVKYLSQVLMNLLTGKNLPNGAY
jgi:hypothetical protein